MADFLMPKLGADMKTGTLVVWHKNPGDHFKRGDVMAEVDTDKGVIDVEVFFDGVVEQHLVQPGEQAPVGTALAKVRQEGTPSMPSPPAEAPAPPPQSATVSGPVPHPPPVAPEVGRSRMSPSARALARKLGVDAMHVEGTGPAGAITREDVERAAAAAKPVVTTPAPAADRLARMRQSIAAAMSRSKREIPHYYLSTTIDLHNALTWLAQENEKRPVTERLLYGVLLLKAVALALKEVPELNGFWDGERASQQGRINVGMAIALRQGGLIAPAVHDVDKLNLGELMQKVRDLVNRARAGSLRSSELSDPTITVTNLGEQGVETVFPVIYPPQVAIVGLGKVVTRPWVVEGQVVPRPVVTAALAADHRVSDGHRGGLFLAAVDRLLQEPNKL